MIGKFSKLPYHTKALRAGCALARMEDVAVRQPRSAREFHFVEFFSSKIVAVKSKKERKNLYIWNILVYTVFKSMFFISMLINLSLLFWYNSSTIRTDFL